MGSSGPVAQSGTRTRCQNRCHPTTLGNKGGMTERVHTPVNNLQYAAPDPAVDDTPVNAGSEELSGGGGHERS
jgi:hypothetical protein